MSEARPITLTLVDNLIHVYISKDVSSGAIEKIACGIDEHIDRLIDAHEKVVFTPGELGELIKRTRMDQREKLAEWMLKSGLSTGHGDTIEDLIEELDLQVAELRTRAGESSYD